MASATPTIDATREVRFAVVMYGGVSLAIYIHGVTRELLSLVRSTAPEKRGGDRARPVSSGSEIVYRKLGQMLQAGEFRVDDWELGARGEVQLRAGRSEPPIGTRFVVDVLSGTSAGGINAVFLAKALANDEDITPLGNLWVTEGDIGLLINDRASRDKHGFSSPAEPASLLNGNRMYAKLLDALNGMDGDDNGDSQNGSGLPPDRRDARWESPLVDELDLFVTATDLRGLQVPIRVADDVIQERRHRNVFRFLYATRYASGGEPRNDFHARDNPFLAFAARCTSAFPVAFEPMRLNDVQTILPGSAGILGAAAAWSRFYRDYEATAFGATSFADGGYLDNKPFTWATGTLARRRADVPPDRKLLYIEPAPEVIEAHVGREKPDMLENLRAALVGLPRYETIREDLERLDERNELIRHINEVLRDRDRDVEHRKVEGPTEEEHARWRDSDLKRMIRDHGVAYGAYHRMKVAALMNELAELLVRVAGIREQSTRYKAVCYLVEQWKNHHYTTYLTEGDARATENAFLYDFDLSWWLRRVRSVLQKSVELLEGGGLCRRLVCSATSVPDTHPVLQDGSPEREAFKAELRRIRCGLNEVLVFLRSEGRRLRSRDPLANSGTHAAIGLLALDNVGLEGLLDLPEAQRAARVKRILGDQFEAFDDLARSLREEMGAIIYCAGRSAKLVVGLDPDQDTRAAPTDAAHASLCKLALNQDLREHFMQLLSGSDDGPARIAQRCLAHYYTEFEFYDMIAFPILHEAGVGESDVVEVLRVSPIDARRLVADPAARRKKLAGTALSNFGAFFVREWREHDMLWGRLDAAERLVCALVPDAVVPEKDSHAWNIREALIRELHEAILDESLTQRLHSDFFPVLGGALKEALRRRPVTDAERRRIIDDWLLAREQNDQARALELHAVLQAYVKKGELGDFFVRGCDPDRSFPPQPTVQAIARSTRVMGGMLERLAERHEFDKRPIAWITRLGTAFWGLVQVAVPQSLLNAAAHHFIGLLYAFEIFLIAGGAVLSSEVARYGLIALGVTVAAHLAIVMLGRFMRRRSTRIGSFFAGRRLARLALVAFLAGMAVLAFIGADQVWDRWSPAILGFGPLAWLIRRFSG